MALDTDNLEPDSTLGHYLIISRIAQGGMGVVYKAFEARLERCVAIKVLRTEFASNPAFVLHFMEEARAVAALSHPNIVPIHYIGEESGSTFFSMAFINGETFDDWIEKGRFFTEDEAFGFMHSAISALDFAHKSNIIHLDIKPSNFLIDQEQNIFLTDFGLAESLARDRPKEKRGFGTPPYISPEQLWGSVTDQRTDIYSLGATLYHLMVGQAPFIGNSDEEIVRGHLHQPFPAGKALRAGVSRGWVELLRKMMEKDADARFSNYLEIYDALQKLRELQNAPIIDYPARLIISTGAVNFEERALQNKPRASSLLKVDCEQMLALALKMDGKVFKTYRGGLYLSFKSPEKGLQWAFEILKQLEDPEKTPPDRLEHRIGIHFGPFYGQGESLYGDSIIIAKRLQLDGDSGTVSLTATVLDLIEDKSWLNSKLLGTEYAENGEPIESFLATLIEPPPKEEEPKPIEAEPEPVPEIKPEPEVKPAKPLPPSQEPAKPKMSASLKAFLLINGVLLIVVVLVVVVYGHSIMIQFQNMTNALKLLQKAS